MNEKKGFILYYDNKEAVDTLSDDEAGKLFKALLNHGESGRVPDLPPSAKMAFMFISGQIRRDTDKYKKICEKRRDSGKKGGEAKAKNIKQNMANVANAKAVKQNMANVANAKAVKQNMANVADKEKEREKETDNNKKDIVGKKPTPPYKAIIDYLNEKTNSRYKYTTKSTQRIINGRFDDGFTLEDFKIVIDVKSSQWLGDKKMAAYLRPETLFAASHFESYLNECRLVKPQEPKHSGISEKLARETSDNLLNTDDCGEFM